MSFLTDRLRTELDCRQLAEHYGVRFRKRSTGWWLAHCFNSESHRRGDRNPSLSISAQGYKCFSANCAISGDAFTMIAHFEGLSLREDFEEILKIASAKADLDYSTLRLEEKQRHASRPVYKNPTQWKRYKKREERERRRRKTDQLKYGALSPARNPLTQPEPKPKAPSEDLRHTIYRFMVSTLDPNTPPPLNDHFPDPFQDAFSIDPRHKRLEIMQNIWDIVAPLDLSDQAVKWLKSRGINPDIAHAYGCRDWSSAADQLRELLSLYSVEELEQTGLVRTQQNKQKIWTGLRALQREDWAQGLGVPVVHPGWPVAPIAWRWRLFNPFKTRDGKSFKAIAQYSGEPHMPSLPLGMTPPTSSALKDLSRWPSLSSTPEEPRYAVVLCEGEPDWLSVAEVSSHIESDLYIVPVGLIAMSHGYPPHMSGILEGAERIVCVMDRGNTNKKYALTGGEVVVEQVRGTLLYQAMMNNEPFEHAFNRIENKIVSSLQKDDFDVNDLHKHGQLQPLIEQLFGDLL